MPGRMRPTLFLLCSSALGGAFFSSCGPEPEVEGPLPLAEEIRMANEMYGAFPSFRDALICGFQVMDRFPREEVRAVVSAYTPEQRLLVQREAEEIDAAVNANCPRLETGE
jgi:hypothetical protein